MNTASKPRIKPVDVDLTEPLKSKMEKVFPAALRSPNLYRSVARNEALFIDMIDMNFIGPTGLLDRKMIPPRRRELLILRKRCVNRGVAYLASAGIFFKDHGRRLSMSSTVSACGKAVNTCLRY
mgnify:CR=1 FL=1